MRNVKFMPGMPAGNYEQYTGNYKQCFAKSMKAYGNHKRYSGNCNMNISN